jgi:hypothetical protein
MEQDWNAFLNDSPPYALMLYLTFRLIEKQLDKPPRRHHHCKCERPATGRQSKTDPQDTGQAQPDK